MLLNAEKREIFKLIDRHQDGNIKRNDFNPNTLTDLKKQNTLKKQKYIPLQETEPFVFPEQSF